MAKRLTDTDKWKKPFLRGLDAPCKLLWFYICDDCDHAGIWHVDLQVAEIRTGEKLDHEAVVEMLGKKIVVFDKGEKWFIPSFIEFQYPGGLNPGNKVHDSVIQILKKYDLLDCVDMDLPSPSQGAKDKDKDMDKDKEMDGKGGGGKPKRQPNIKPEKRNQSAEAKTAYDALIQEVQAQDDMREQRGAIGSFIVDHKPHFIEPYMDLWNLSVKKYSVSQVENASEGRLKKFKVRVREPAFDFIKILTEINQSDYLQGKKTDWKIDWDWIFENDTNYLKIIEGKYRNTGN